MRAMPTLPLFDHCRFRSYCQHLDENVITFNTMSNVFRHAVGGVVGVTAS